MDLAHDARGEALRAIGEAMRRTRESAGSSALLAAVSSGVVLDEAEASASLTQAYESLNVAFDHLRDAYVVLSATAHSGAT